MTPSSQMPRRPLLAAMRQLRTYAAVSALAATLVVTGCSAPKSSSNAADAASQEASRTAVSSTAELKAAPKATQPASAASVLAAKVKESLAALGNSTKSPHRDQMIAAMLDAGAVKDKIEVSLDRTPTGLAVDAIEAAVPLAKQCVIGQLRDGKATVTVLPLLASGRCFVGDEH